MNVSSLTWSNRMLLDTPNSSGSITAILTASENQPLLEATCKVDKGGGAALHNKMYKVSATASLANR